MAEDGVVSLSEFIESFLDFTKKMKIPKQELIGRLQQLVAEAEGLDQVRERADLDEVKQKVARVDLVLSKYS